METHIAAQVTYSWKASCLRGCMSVWVKENRGIANQGHRGLKYTSTTLVRRGSVCYCLPHIPTTVTKSYCASQAYTIRLSMLRKTKVVSAFKELTDNSLI